MRTHDLIANFFWVNIGSILSAIVCTHGFVSFAMTEAHRGVLVYSPKSCLAASPTMSTIFQL
eukprot:2746643-Amphidinium_carterae.1